MPIKTIEPWQHEGGIWKTQSAYFSWLRGQIRRGCWGRNPIKNYIKRQAAKPAPAGSRAKKVIQCEFCNQWLAQSKIEVDHVIPAGSMNQWEDIGPFMQRMLDPSGGYRLLCKPCHEQHTYAEKMGVSFDQAGTLKKIISITKMPAAKQIEWMKKHNIHTEQNTRNAATRKAAITIHFNQ